MNFFEWLNQNKDLLTISISFLALVISGLSIGLAFISIRMNKNHFIKSIKPIAIFNICDYESRVSVSIKNCGSGPLIINKFKAFNDSGNSASDIISLMPELPADMYWSTFVTRFEGYTILPSDSITLVEFKLDTKNVAETKVRDTIRKVLSQLAVELFYQDIYDNKMPKASRSLDWFSRNLTEMDELAV